MDRPKKKRVHTIDSSELFDEDSGVLPIEAIGSTKVPCSVQGLTSALGGGTVGYVFGFGRTLFNTRKWTPLHKAGIESGATFALFGGVYAAMVCFCSRLRQKDDFWNGGLAGCATGLALSWKGGPISALQSCVGIGVLSALFDVIGKEPAAEAHPLSIYDAAFVRGSVRKGRKRRQKGKGGGRDVGNEVKLARVPCRQCRPGFWFLRCL